MERDKRLPALRISNRDFLELAMNLKEKNPQTVMVTDEVLKLFKNKLKTKLNHDDETIVGNNDAVFSVKAFTRGEANNASVLESTVFSTSNVADEKTSLALMFLDGVTDVKSLYYALRAISVKELVYFSIFGFVFIVGERKVKEEATNSYIVIRLGFLKNLKTRTDLPMIDKYMEQFFKIASKGLNDDKVINVIKLGPPNGVITSRNELENLYDLQSVQSTEPSYQEEEEEENTSERLASMRLKKKSGNIFDDTTVMGDEEQRSLVNKLQNTAASFTPKDTVVDSDNLEKIAKIKTKVTKWVGGIKMSETTNKLWDKSESKLDGDAYTRSMEKNAEVFFNNYAGRKWEEDLAQIDNASPSDQIVHTKQLKDDMRENFSNMDRISALTFCCSYFDFDLDDYKMTHENIPSNYTNYKEVRRRMIICTPTTDFFDIFYLFDSNRKVTDNVLANIPNILASTEKNGGETIWGVKYQKHLKETGIEESVNKTKFFVNPMIIEDHLIYDRNNINILSESAEGLSDEKKIIRDRIVTVLETETSNIMTLLEASSGDVDKSGIPITILEKWLSVDFDSATAIILYEWNKFAFSKGNNWDNHVDEIIARYMEILKPYFNKGIREKLADESLKIDEENLEEVIPEFKQLSDFIDLMMSGNTKVEINNKVTSCFKYPNTMERVLFARNDFAGKYDTK